MLSKTYKKKLTAALTNIQKEIIDQFETDPMTTGWVEPVSFWR